MAKKIDLQERLNMRFLTVAYKEKQETYGTYSESADTGSIALDVLNIPDSVLEELLELTDPMIELVDFLNKNRNPDSTTYQKIKDTLIEAGIPANHIAIKTADKDELKGINLMSSECPIRYIITVNALKEGWDCPFAYVLATVANRTSSVDVEQILGRVLRLPNTKKNPSNVLNLSYVITCSANFYQTLDKVVAGLNNAGFSSKDYRAKDVEAEVTVEPVADPGEQLVIQPPVVEVPVIEDEELPVVDLEDLKAKVSAATQTETPAEDTHTAVDDMLNTALNQNDAYENEISNTEETAVNVAPQEVRDKMNVFIAS